MSSEERNEATRVTPRDSSNAAVPIYNEEPGADLERSLTGTHLEQIVASREPWVDPFVVRLPGLAVPGSAPWEFIARNPAFFARTERRVMSYWSCYYRWKYAVLGTYPGRALMEAFRAIGTRGRAVAAPHATPRRRAWLVDLPERSPCRCPRSVT